MADRTQIKIRETLLAHHAWPGLPFGGGGHWCAFIGAPIHPVPIVLAHQCPCSITNGAPNTFGAPIIDENQFISQTQNLLKVVDRTFRCASPIFTTIAY